MVYGCNIPAKIMDYQQENTSKQGEHQGKMGRVQYGLQDK
jgi:hypothetical protein